jgi:glutamyl-tRNA reductase
MQLVVLGLNHKTAPVEIRERFTVSSQDISNQLLQLDDYSGIDEVVVLSTCNRSEIYAVINDEKKNNQVLHEFFFHLAHTKEDNPDYFYYYTGSDCIFHLLRVASSLDSLVLGEGQILSQVKQAYTLAHTCDATGAILNVLFHQAIATGKRVRTDTHIAYNAVSISYAAVQLAEQVLGSVENKNILIYGAGQMAELTARNFRGKKVNQIYVVNRHMDRARKLADKMEGTAIHFRNVESVADKIDIVITSTGAPHYVIYPQRVHQFLALRSGRPLVFIDIAVPRDVDPVVGSMQNVTLYNIDMLESAVQNNEKLRRQEAAAAALIVREDTNVLLERFRYLSVRPVMVRLAEKADRIRRHELKRSVTKLPQLDEHQYRILDHMSRMIVRKLLRDPMIRAAQAAETPEEKHITGAMADLFKLDIAKENTFHELDHRNEEQ